MKLPSAGGGAVVVKQTPSILVGRKWTCYSSSVIKKQLVLVLCLVHRPPRIFSVAIPGDLAWIDSSLPDQSGVWYCDCEK